jgi:hypothetical protein
MIGAPPVSIGNVTSSDAANVQCRSLFKYFASGTPKFVVPVSEE